MARASIPESYAGELQRRRVALSRRTLVHGRPATVIVGTVAAPAPMTETISSVPPKSDPAVGSTPTTTGERKRSISRLTLGGSSVEERPVARLVTLTSPMPTLAGHSADTTSAAAPQPRKRNGPLGAGQSTVG